MSHLEEIQSARNAIETAQTSLRSVAKTAIREECEKIFALPGITSVSWAQKSSEYNDEGMYEGVYGPVLNRPYDPTDDEAGADDDRWERWYDVLYPGYGSSSATDHRLKPLADILNGLGQVILSDIFGDECAVDVRIDSNGNLSFDSEYAGC